MDELDSEIKQIQSRLQITQHNIVVSKNALHFLLNHNPGVMNIKTSFQRINTTHVIPSNLPVTVLKHRPDVREAESILKAANADVGVATTSLLPSISLGAYLGQGSSITGPISLSEGYLNTPLLDFPVIGQIRVSRARYHALCRKYINTVRQALRDVENDLSAYTTYTNQFNNNKRAFTHEKQRCHWVDIRYQRGIDNDRNRIQCHIKLDQFELMLNQNKLEKMLTIVSLYQDLAGGYHGV